MFHLFSKLLSFFLSPYLWLEWSLILSFIVKTKKVKVILRGLALTVFLLLGNRALINLVYEAIESKPLFQQNITVPYEYGVILGGGFARSNHLFPDRVFFGRHINRLTEAMELVKSGKVKKLILSGGIGGISRFKDYEMEHIKTFLLENQWPDSSILTEIKSKNTYENAVNTHKILDSLGVRSKIVLITSALHMPRAEGCFRKQGIDIDPYAADYLQRDKLEYPEYFIPDLECLGEWESILREWIGTAVYKMKGYI